MILNIFLTIQLYYFNFRVFKCSLIFYGTTIFLYLNFRLQLIKELGRYCDPTLLNKNSFKS